MSKELQIEKAYESISSTPLLRQDPFQTVSGCISDQVLKSLSNGTSASSLDRLPQYLSAQRKPTCFA